MNRRWVSLVVVVLALALGGCADLLQQMGASPEDAEALSDLAEAAANAAQDAAQGADDPGSDAPGSADPDWSPRYGPPPPPGTPSESEDYTGEGSCPSDRTCGWATYDGDDGSAARDHYEDLYGPPTSETRLDVRNAQGEPYQSVTTTWDNGDEKVTVYTDHHGTDISVEVDPTP